MFRKAKPESKCRRVPTEICKKKKCEKRRYVFIFKSLTWKDCFLPCLFFDVLNSFIGCQQNCRKKYYLFYIIKKIINIPMWNLLFLDMPLYNNTYSFHSRCFERVVMSKEMVPREKCEYKEKRVCQEVEGSTCRPVTRNVQSLHISIMFSIK